MNDTVIGLLLAPVINVLLKPLKPGVLYALADHIRDRYAQSEKTAASSPVMRPESRQESGPESRQESDIDIRILAAPKAKPLSRTKSPRRLATAPSQAP